MDSLSLPLLFGLVGIYLVPLPAKYFSAFSSCLYCYVWGGLSVFCQFVVPLYCGCSLLWVGLDGWLVKVSWLRKLMSVFWWVELDFFSLECSEVSSSEFWYVSGFWCDFGQPVYWSSGLSFCVFGEFAWYVLLWNLLAWFHCRYGGFWMSSYWLMFPGVRSSLVFSGFGLKLPASGFQSYSYSCLKTSPSIQHWWETSR